jgi:hypothetical protein
VRETNNFLILALLLFCDFLRDRRPVVATRNIFWVICDNFFSSSFWLPEIVIGSSDIVPEFTFGTGLLINEKNPLLDFEETRYVNEL